MIKQVRERLPSRDATEKQVFISNDLKRTSEEIAALYKQRWEIELFFKWIKQNLKIKRFIGRSENAVMIQVLVAMIAYLLLKLAQLSNGYSLLLQKIGELVSVYLTSRRLIFKLLHPDPAHSPPAQKLQNQLLLRLGDA